MEFIILSPYNSGSNLMKKLLESTESKVCNIKYQIFKHCIHKNVLKQKIDKYPKLNIIIMYRDIFQWIKSCKKYKYNISQVKNIDKQINFGCECKNIGKASNKLIKVYFKNLLEFHNTYYDNYKFLMENCKNNFFLINYDNLIKPIDNIIYIYSLFSNLGITTKKDIEKVLSKPSKSHGGSVNSYLEAYNKTKSIKQHFSSNDIKIIETKSTSYEMIKDKLYNVKIQQEYL